MIDLLLILIIAGVTWAVAAEGPWGAAMVLFSVVLSGLLAMNLFEPMAGWMETILGTYEWQNRWDIICLLGLFSLGVWGLRELTERIMPTTLDVASLVYETRWLLGAATGYVVAAIVLTSLHTAPLPREFIGFKPERKNLFNAVAPDLQWLGFTQYVSEHVMRSGDNGPIFDGAVFPRIAEDPSSQQVWSSFPIRYAQRRTIYAATGEGAGPALSAPPPPTAAPVPTQPAGAPVPGGRPANAPSF
jgi:hypothetical protein